MKQFIKKYWEVYCNLVMRKNTIFNVIKTIYELFGLSKLFVNPW